MKTIVSALIALSVLAGIAAPASAARRQGLLRATRPQQRRQLTAAAEFPEHALKSEGDTP